MKKSVCLLLLSMITSASVQAQVKTYEGRLDVKQGVQLTSSRTYFSFP